MKSAFPGPMTVLDRADPRLAEAHRLLWEVREHCYDAALIAILASAMLDIREARFRVARIERAARDAE